MTARPLGAVLAVALLAFIGAHVAIVIALARRKEHRHAVIALFVLPLAALWAWRAGLRALVYAWTIALALYALGVTLA